jgi:hypothetical protein
MFTHRCIVPALLATLGLSGATLAQPSGASSAGAGPSPATTVQGVTISPEPSPHERYAQSLNFVTSHGAPARSGQFARWADPPCPVTVGLSPAMNALVSNRVMALAIKVNAPGLRRRLCKPNIEILFTDRPQELLDLVARKRQNLLGFHYVPQTKALETVSRPIQAWYLTSTENGAGARALDVADNQMPAGCAGSPFSSCLRSVFTNVLIVADGAALEGKAIGPAADYIALLALSQSRSLDGCDALPSILDWLSPKCGVGAPDALTKADIGYLKALYGLHPELKMWLAKDYAGERMASPAKTTGEAPKP